jgi:hypothetical protein
MRSSDLAPMGGRVVEADETFTGRKEDSVKRHLHRYVAEFDFRYNNRVRAGVGDTERTTRALGGIVGRRLTYRDSSAASV